MEPGVPTDTPNRRPDDVTAIVLAGGLGTRLRARVADRPKPLAEVGGRPFVTYVLDWIGAAGITRAVLATGHRGAQVEAALGARAGNVALEYARERRPLGTGGALRAAAQRVASAHVVVCNGDSLCAADLNAFLAWYRARCPALALVATRVPDTADLGRLRLDDRNGDRDGDRDRVVGFAEKDGVERPGWVNAGIYAMPAAFARGLPASLPLSFERDVLARAVTAELVAWRTTVALFDIGTPENFARAQRHWRAGAPC